MVGGPSVGWPALAMARRMTSASCVLKMWGCRPTAAYCSRHCGPAHWLRSDKRCRAHQTRKTDHGNVINGPSSACRIVRPSSCRVAPVAKLRVSQAAPTTTAAGDVWVHPTSGCLGTGAGRAAVCSGHCCGGWPALARRGRCGTGAALDDPAPPGRPSRGVSTISDRRTKFRGFLSRPGIASSVRPVERARYRLGQPGTHNVERSACRPVQADGRALLSRPRGSHQNAVRSGSTEDHEPCDCSSSQCMGRDARTDRRVDPL